ncbi:MAG: 23S rRNA (adenine(2503)-C(2))-methyltransferase RlmN, partial [Thermoanaerobaculia bacterium]
MQDLLGLPPLDVARAVREIAPESFRASQIFKWIHERRAADFKEM